MGAPFATTPPPDPHGPGMYSLQKHILFGNTDEELQMQAVMFLATRGIVVSMPGAWETPGEFCVRVGISCRHFSRVFRSRWAPQIQSERGITGRLIRVRSTPEFDAYAQQRSRRRYGQESRISCQVEDRRETPADCQTLRNR